MKHRPIVPAFPIRTPCPGWPVLSGGSGLGGGKGVPGCTGSTAKPLSAAILTRPGTPRRTCEAQAPPSPSRRRNKTTRSRARPPGGRFCRGRRCRRNAPGAGVQSERTGAAGKRPASQPGLHLNRRVIFRRVLNNRSAATTLRSSRSPFGSVRQLLDHVRAPRAPCTPYHMRGYRSSAPASGPPPKSFGFHSGPIARPSTSAAAWAQAREAP
jgi:hypothetical protein